MRVEYLKARARATRYTEQLVLLVEEKRRVLATLDYEANIWKERQKTAVGVSAAETQGLTAYAARQADLRLKMREKFATMWAKPVADPSPNEEVVADIEDAVAGVFDSDDEGSDSDDEN